MSTEEDLRKELEALKQIGQRRSDRAKEISEYLEVFKLKRISEAEEVDPFPDLLARQRSLDEKSKKENDSD